MSSYSSYIDVCHPSGVGWMRREDGGEGVKDKVGVAGRDLEGFGEGWGINSARVGRGQLDELVPKGA
ncbi:hypothetical protein COCNU_scaffold004280G000010 [Cocos nucifera]|nr:hypothetical protein [Cocos nucifera]